MWPDGGFLPVGERDVSTDTNMQTPLAKLIEEMQQHAKDCETEARGKTQAALLGAPGNKEKNQQEARLWRIKSQVWLEAEAVVRGFV
jgi:hypothetical protein